MSLRVLTSVDVRNITSKLSPELLQSLMEDVFALISSSDTGNESSYTPHRTSIPTENHTTLFMPGRISNIGTTMKVVSVPSNPDDTRGLPASTLVLDKDTGAVKAIVNARSLTALRNAAGSLLSTTLVGPVSPVHIAAFGAGAQIIAHLDLHLQVFASVKSCTIINRTLNARVSAVASELQLKHPSVKISVLASASREEVRTSLSTASIIITATPSRVPLFPSSWVRSGTHVILIGSYTPQMKEVDTDLIMRAIPKEGNSLVDSVLACFTEAGELLEANLHSDQVVEIGELVLEKRANSEASSWRDSRELAEQSDDFNGPITVFKSVGVGLQDVAIACAVVDKAEELERLSADGSVGVVVKSFD
ncbi:NAD(P)-binding protein [Gymnopus androsaceus JB14]|uniref:NAD(P)-binding protein n=1 Tax=Gymnopus androsaceus JB14 TaxID=1447944 RepID=A0A6A4IJP6_9AGAR|nr:NAD(P)-binding protein [Gymnopus androsaceus JB14]